jgi:hypothetical protein
MQRAVSVAGKEWPERLRGMKLASLDGESQTTCGGLLRKENQ